MVILRKIVLFLLLGVVNVAVAQTPQELPTHIREGSDAFLSASFKDQNGMAVVPDDISYYVTDETSGIRLQGPTPIPTVAGQTTYSLAITRCSSRIIQNGKTTENKLATVVYKYGGSSIYTGTDYARWPVDNIPNLVVGTPIPTTGICNAVPQATPTP